MSQPVTKKNSAVKSLSVKVQPKSTTVKNKKSTPSKAKSAAPGVAKAVAKKAVAKKAVAKKVTVKAVISPVAAPSITPSTEVGSKNIYLSNKELLLEVKKAKKLDVMTNRLAQMLQLLCGKYAKKGNFVNYCVDDQTQALTANGWKSYDQLSTRDTILSYELPSKQLKWSKIHNIFVNEHYDGKMFHLTTEGLDALVTPSHKFVSLENGIKPVEQIICNEHIVLMGMPVESNNAVHSDGLVELVGWCITEGHYSTQSKEKHSIRISQKFGAKADGIRDLLTTLRVPFKEYTQDDIISFHCTGEVISSIHTFHAPHRVLTPAFIVSLTTYQRELLIKTMVQGDGWIRPSGGMSYAQKCKEHIDAFLMLCTLAGQTTSVAVRTYKTPGTKNNPEGSSSDVYTVNIYAQPKLFCRGERIDFHGGRSTPGGDASTKQNTPTLSYKGVIWCPTTDHGTFVCRRGKYIFVTGNSYNEDMQAYAMMMLVRTWKSFNPEKSNNPFAFFTQCIKHSFIQYLNQEKRQRSVRDLMLIDQGMNPSFGFTDDASDKHFVDDEEDYQSIQELLKTKSDALDDLDVADTDDPVSPVIHLDPSTVDPMFQSDELSSV